MRSDEVERLVADAPLMAETLALCDSFGVGSAGLLARVELHVAARELRELFCPAAYAAADRTVDEPEMLQRDARARDLERERVLIVTRNAAHTCLGATRRVGRTSDVCSIPWSWWPGWSGYIAGSPGIGRCSSCGSRDGPTVELSSGSANRTSRPWTGSHGRRIASGVSSRIPTDWCPPPGVGRPINNVPPLNGQPGCRRPGQPIGAKAWRSRPSSTCCLLRDRTPVALSQRPGRVHSRAPITALQLGAVTL